MIWFGMMSCQLELDKEKFLGRKILYVKSREDHNLHRWSKSFIIWKFIGERFVSIVASNGEQIGKCKNECFGAFWKERLGAYLGAIVNVYMTPLQTYK